MCLNPSYLNYNYRHVYYKSYKVIHPHNRQQQRCLFQDTAGHSPNLVAKTGTDSRGLGIQQLLTVPRQKTRDDTLLGADSYECAVHHEAGILLP